MAETSNQSSTVDLESAKRQLLDLKARLEKDIAVKEQEVAEDGDDLVQERGGLGNHMADDATSTSEQVTMLTLQHSTERQLAQVNSALERIDAGTYGMCANCGKPISPERLEARPLATLCIDCQQLSDRGKL